MQLTDTGNAERLITMFGDELVYCPSMKAWYRWDGRSWCEDTGNNIYQLAIQVAQSYELEADNSDSTDPDRSRKFRSLIKWAQQSASLRNIQAMVTLAQSHKDVCMDMAWFDRDPFLFNVENGTIDLRDGTYQKFDPSNFITKRAPVTFVRRAKCPLWEGFLADVIPNSHTRSFLQTAVGYSLTASTAEEKMLILHGTGRNGKTTFINTILNLMGSYASQASSRTLVRKRESGPKDDLFVLMGKRFVAATETGESHHLDENLIKQITGGNRISVNPKYRTQMEFTPTWKLWLDTNYEPAITGTDVAIWRRLLKIPFHVTIPESECDPTLKHALMTNQTERSGILNWAIEGAIRWRADGLTPSKEIVDATKSYYINEDFVGQFLNERCRIHPRLMISKVKLYEEYVRFCRENNESPKTKNGFGREISERRISDTRTKNERHWIGIALDNRVSLLPQDAI